MVVRSQIMNPNTKPILLLVEDDLGDVLFLETVLGKMKSPFELKVTNSFFDAKSFLNEHKADIVLLDLSLPDVNGFKTLSRFLDLYSHIPVIVLTGNNSEIIGAQFIRAGAQDFLVKGQFDHKLLGRTIRYAMQHFKTHQNLEQASEQLSYNKRRDQQVQSMSQMGSWTMDLVTCEMEWSDGLFQIFGFPPRSIKPTLSDYLRYVHPEDRPAVQEFFSTVQKEGVQSQIDHRMIVQGYSLKWVSLTAKVWYDEPTETILLIGAVQNVTARWAAASPPAHLADNRLADLSFQIRTPLASVVQWLFLLEKADQEAQQAEALHNLKLAVEDLTISTDQLLNLAFLSLHNDFLQESAFQPHQLLRSLRQFVRLKTRNKKLQVSFQWPDDLPSELVSDLPRLTLLLYNLLSEVIGKEPGPELHIEVQLRREPDLTLEMKICDQGPPIGRADIEAYQPTTSIPDPTELTGKNGQLPRLLIGRLVELLKANLTIRPGEDFGNCYVLSLPVKLATETGAEARPNSPFNILLVEDHSLNQIAVRKLLQSWSHQVRIDIVENGQEAVEKMEAQEYDLVLMDLQLPVLDGLSAARKIREFSNVPIIALTAMASAQEKERCLQLGLDDYLAKPFQPAELYAKISQLLPLAVD